MPSLPQTEKDKLISQASRLGNYCILKTGFFAIASVYGLADFMSAGVFLRILYVIIWLLFVFYIYFLIDTKKFVRKIIELIKSS